MSPARPPEVAPAAWRRRRPSDRGRPGSTDGPSMAVTVDFPCVPATATVRRPRRAARASGSSLTRECRARRRGEVRDSRPARRRCRRPVRFPPASVLGVMALKQPHAGISKGLHGATSRSEPLSGHPQPSSTSASARIPLPAIPTRCARRGCEASIICGEERSQYIHARLGAPQKPHSQSQAIIPAEKRPWKMGSSERTCAS